MKSAFIVFIFIWDEFQYRVEISLLKKKRNLKGKIPHSPMH